MQYLLKTEPSVYSFSNLQKEQSTIWDGVTNPVAVKHLRAMQKGDKLVIYHTGDERQAVGLGSVVRTWYPDPKKDNPRLIVIDVSAGVPLARPVALSTLKADPRFAESPLVRMGRLSVVELTEEQYAAILDPLRQPVMRFASHRADIGEDHHR